MSNPERVDFVAYDTQKVRYIVFIIAAFFAGISGGLAALNFEIVTSEVVSGFDIDTDLFQSATNNQTSAVVNTIEIVNRGDIEAGVALYWIML